MKPLRYCSTRDVRQGCRALTAYEVDLAGTVVVVDLPRERRGDDSSEGEDDGEEGEGEREDDEADDTGLPVCERALTVTRGQQ